MCFIVRAMVTGADLKFSVEEVDFGYCTTTESVRQTITMTNQSILPQLYGFCGVPQVQRPSGELTERLNMLTNV